MREARAAAALDAPGIVRVAGCGRLEDGRTWVAMEWIDGITLEDALGEDAGQRWPLARTLGIAAQLARALAAAHVAGIVHRDLKPSNVMVRRGSDQVVIVDFGIARRAGDTASSVSRCAGTPHYMAPEQALGEDVDARADLYSLGCVLVRMTTGRVPFDGSAVEVLLAHLGQPPPALDGVPPAVATLIGRLLAKRPRERPPSAAAVADRLDALARDAAPIDPFDATVPVTTLAPRSLPHLTPLPPTRRQSVPGRRTATLAITCMAAIAVGVGSFTAVRTLQVDSAVADPTPRSPAPPVPPLVPAPRSPLPAERADRMVIVVDSGHAMRATMLGMPMAGGELAIELAIWDDADLPIAATQVAATIRSPGGRTVGFGVAGTDGVFRLRQPVADAGAHIVTVYAPSGETTFTVRVEVGSRPSA